jgi:hypothetical protein
MAKATVTHVTDDLDGTADAQNVTFGFQGVAYSIDLSQKNLDKLTKALAPFIEHSTKHRGSPTAARKAAGGRAARPYDLVQLREWAGKNKIKVPSRGRIPRSVVEQYQAAGGR